MRVAIVYDSRTGTTRAAAEDMARLARDRGHECDVVPIASADAEELSKADAVCVGSWTEGLFFILQHATKPTMAFIDRLSLKSTPAAVFCTYKTSPGKMLDKMADRLMASGGTVTARLRSRGRTAPDGFGRWLDGLGG